MTLKTFRRMIEAFFRRWPIYVAILVAAIGFGISTISGTEDLYTSRGTVFVESQSLVTSQSGVASPTGFTYLTAAQTTSDQLRGLLQTDIFLASVVDRADADLVQGPSIDFDDPSDAAIDDDESDRYNLATVRPPPDPQAWADQATEIRESVSVYAVNENLMNIDATTVDPALSHSLSFAIIEELIEFQITLDVAESVASEDFFLNLAGSYEQDVIDTRQAVDQALRGIDPEEEISELEQREIDRLREAEVLAAAKYRNALDEVELARLLNLQTQTDIQQSFSVFDPPRVPTEPDQSLVGELRILISAAAVGLALALVIPVVIGLLQRTVLFADDLEGIAPVLAVVPRVRRSVLRLPTVAGEEEDGEETTIATLPRVQDQATQTLTYDSTDLGLELHDASLTDEPSESRSLVDADDLLAELEAADEQDRVEGDPVEADPVAPSAPAVVDEASTTEEVVAIDGPPPTDEAVTEEAEPEADEPDEAPSSDDDLATTEANGDAEPAAPNGSASPDTDADESTEPVDLGSQTQTFSQLQAGPMGPVGPPEAVKPPAPVAEFAPSGPPPPPDLESFPPPGSGGTVPLTEFIEGAAGVADPTVTAEITHQGGKPGGPPGSPRPLPPPPGPGPGDDPNGPGFSVQAHADTKTKDETGPADAEAAASDAGSMADDETTETNNA